MRSQDAMHSVCAGLIVLMVGGALAQAPASPAAKQPAPPPATQPTSGPAGRIEVDTRVFDFGEVWQYMPPKKDVTIRNTGEGPLTVEVSASCGCTPVTKPKSPLSPGESTTFTITYDARAAGDVNKTVTILSNDPTQASVVINVKGKVKPMLKFDPSERITFQDLEPESPPASQKIRITNSYERPVHLKLKENQDFGRFEIAFKEITAGQEYELTATTRPPLKVGQNRLSVVLQTDVEHVQSILVHVFANAQPRVFPMPMTLAVDESQTKAHEQTLSIVHRLESPVKVTDVKSELPGFKYMLLPPEAPPQGSRQGYIRLRVTLPGYQDVPETGGKLYVYTDDPSPTYQKLEVDVIRRPKPTTTPAATGPILKPVPRPVPVPQPKPDEAQP